MQREWGWAPIGTTHTYDIVETVKRGEGWDARLTNDHGTWEAGHTESEALGQLFIRLWREEHPEPAQEAPRCRWSRDGSCELAGNPLANAIAGRGCDEMDDDPEFCYLDTK